VQGIAAIAIGLLVIGSILVGVRLLALHRSTGAAPELMLGGMLLLAVGVGYPLMIATPRVGPDWAARLQLLSTIAVNVGFSLLFAFTWRVFRPDAAWARLFAGAAILGMLGTAVRRSIQVATHGAYDANAEPLSEVVLQGGPVMVGYFWAAWESLRYYGMMRRRVGLGLADAAVCNRFLLWGLMSLTVNAGIVVNIGAFAVHVDSLSSPWVLILSSTTGLTQAVLLFLAFMPPASYTRWVQARAAARSA
jgi:hypothetical protein